MKHVNILIDRAVEGSPLSYNKIGHEVGYTSGQFVYNWRKGISTPPLDKVNDLCKILKIKPEDYKKALLKDYKEKINNEIK